MKQMWIGCSGFYNRHWKEIFYPADLRQKDWFAYYSKYLNTLEINTTFYKFPTAESLNKWYQESPERFMFSVKAPRLITHFKKLTDSHELLEDFYAACYEGLKEKLGCVLFQFPPTFSYSPERLLLITTQFNFKYKNVVEFRHTSWWNEDVLELLELNHIIFCRPDHPMMPDLYLDFSKRMYIRLHGNPVLFYSDYNEEFLDILKNGLLQNEFLEEAYIYFNNTAGNAGILNALRLKEKMLAK